MQTKHTLNPAVRGSLFYLCYWGAVGVYMPFINLYFAQLGLTGTQIGVLAALMPLMALTVAPALSAIADRRGQRVRALVLIVAGLGVALALLFLPRSFLALVPLVALLAFFRCAIGPISDSLIARMAVRHRLNFGGMRLWGSLGFALLAIGCGALWQRVGFVMMFPLAGLLCIPVAWSAALLPEAPVVAQHERKPLRTLGQDRGLVTLLAATFMVGAALGMDGAFQAVYVGYLGGGGLLVGMLFGVSAFSEFPSMRYAQAIANRLGGPATLLFAYGLLGVNYIGFAITHNPLVLIPLVVLKGFGFGLYFTNTVRLVDERTPPEWAATIQAILNAGAGGLAPLVASLLGGAVYDTLGPPAIYVSCAAAIGLAMTILVAGVLRGVFQADVLRHALHD